MILLLHIFSSIVVLSLCVFAHHRAATLSARKQERVFYSLLLSSGLSFASGASLLFKNVSLTHFCIVGGIVLSLALYEMLRIYKRINMRIEF